MGEKSSDQEYSAAETAKRADAALRIALQTPPKPHSESKIGKPKPKEAKACSTVRKSPK